MNAVQRAIYERVQCEGNWLVDWKQTTHEEQQAILWLRKRGYIECAAWGGLRIKGQGGAQVPPPVNGTKPALYIRIFSMRTSYRVELVTADGKRAMIAYDGPSAVARTCAVKYLRRMGYGGWDDPKLVSTSGGGGEIIGYWERLHIAGLSGRRIA